MAKCKILVNTWFKWVYATNDDVEKNMGSVQEAGSTLFSVIFYLSVLAFLSNANSASKLPMKPEGNSEKMASLSSPTS